MSIVVQELIDDLMKIVERLELEMAKDDALKHADQNEWASVRGPIYNYNQDEVHGSYLPNEWASRRNRNDGAGPNAMTPQEVIKQGRGE